MGLDATIYFQQTDNFELESELPKGFSVTELEDWQKENFPEATHELDNLCRYYNAGYERGNWPQICATLMILHASKGVAKVWYGSEHYIQLCTPETINQISLHYMQNGRRTYHT